MPVQEKLLQMGHTIQRMQEELKALQDKSNPRFMPKQVELDSKNQDVIELLQIVKAQTTEFATRIDSSFALWIHL